MKRTITDIVIHEADTPTGKPFHASDIDKWHVARGFARTQAWRNALNHNLRAIGYHYVICIDGTEETGRHPDEIGAHCVPNGKSIGICLIGSGKYTPKQWTALAARVRKLLETYPGAKVTGHYQWKSAQLQGKTCPDFDVPKWIANGMQPDVKNIAP